MSHSVSQKSSKPAKIDWQPVKLSLLVGIGIFLGVLDALAVFEWGGLPALGGGKPDPMLGYVVIFGVALWLLAGITLAIVLYWWLHAKRVSDFQQKVARLEAFYRQQETQIGKAQANLLKIGAEITSRRGEGLEVEKQLAVLRDQESKLSKANTALASLIARQNELDAEVRELEHTKKELQSGKEQLEESRTTLQQQLTETQQRIDQRKNDEASLDSSVLGLIQDEEELNSKIAELKSERSVFESKVEQEHSTLVELLKTSDQATPTDFSSSGWYLKLTHGFIKDTQSVDKVLRGQILDAIADIYKRPTELHGDTVKPYTANLKGLWRYRIGDYRLKYQPDSVHKCIKLVDFKSRGDAYE